MYFGANDGARTRDNQNHNLGLYQLSYVRRCRGAIIAFCSKTCQKRCFWLLFYTFSNSKAAQSPRHRLASMKKSVMAALL